VAFGSALVAGCFGRKLIFYMNPQQMVRSLASLGAVAALLFGFTTSASAVPLNVSTTIGASCVVNTGSLAALTPTYGGPSNVSVGSATTLNTTCNTVSPTVAFSDATGAGTVYIMNAGAAVLHFQISNGTSCTGIVSDVAIPQATVEPLVTGANGIYNICAAVIVGQQNATVGAYTDVVTVTISVGV
jgi:hypothetical protein